jgi:hypothetical protein
MREEHVSEHMLMGRAFGGLRYPWDLWKGAMDTVIDELSEAANSVRMDVLMKLAQIQNELDVILE